MRNLCPHHIGPCDCRNPHGLPYRQPPHPIECEDPRQPFIDRNASLASDLATSRHLILELLNHLETNFHDTESCWVLNAKRFLKGEYHGGGF